eukprot:5843316-Prymnesium_polylepis.1
MKFGRYLQFLADLAHFNPGMVRLIAALIFLLVVAHWVGCFWYMICYDTLRTRRVLGDPELELSDILPFRMNEIQGPLGEVSIERSWFYSFYWSCNVMTGLVSFDILLPRGSDGLAVYTLISLFISLIFNFVILSTANSAVSSVDSIAQVDTSIIPHHRDPHC